jgi:hypothetical protein
VRGRERHGKGSSRLSSLARGTAKVGVGGVLPVSGAKGDEGDPHLFDVSND